MRIHLFDACVTSPDYGLSYYLVCLLVTMHYCCRGVVSSFKHAHLNTPVCFVRSFLAVYKSIKSALKKKKTYILLKSSHTGLNWSSRLTICLKQFSFLVLCTPETLG